MRNLLNNAFIGLLAALAVAGCGKTGIETQEGKLPYTVVTRSADAKVEAATIGGTNVTVKMNAAALGAEQNYRFKFTLQPGGSLELRARAKADLSGGVVVKFTRTDKGVKFEVNGDDLSADVARVLGDGSKEIDANIDIHRHSDHAHGIYQVNGKKGGTADFDVVQLQGTWGFVVKKGSVSAFGVGPAKHEEMKD